MQNFGDNVIMVYHGFGNCINISELIKQFEI